MDRGIFAAATGMLAQQAVQDALAGNLANINTTGFKQDIPTFRAVQELALHSTDGTGPQRGASIGDIGTGAQFAGSVTDVRPGALVATQNPLDLALLGDGLFAVETPAGERYTRAGDFHLSQAGKGANGKVQTFLVDASGHHLLGAKGAIDVGAARTVTVEATGDVRADGAVVDRLKVVTAPRSALVKQGGNLLAIQGAPTASTATVQSGFLEQSNVSAVGSMVQMITVQRAYEAAQRAITAQDETLGKAINDVPRV